MESNKKLTYISLFSSAGVGCYGFKEQGFECIATNELIERRLAVQKANNKCKSETGYICGSVTEDITKEKIFKEMEKSGVTDLDVLIATPPCQGMSVANHKKNESDKKRNSLVIESINIVNRIHPKFFIFENVPAFMKTLCTDNDGEDKTIGEAIKCNLSDDYIVESQIINFKNYGACSSRTRCLVIGVRNDLSTSISPVELYPSFTEEKKLRDVIGDLKPLNVMGEIDEEDIYHNFRVYPEYMRKWISCLEEGESSFDNEDLECRPHRIIDGKYVPNKKKNGDKYTRQYWDKVGPCIHTRNDQLASQNTIHPKDDRVFSIRELMYMMTIPYDFKWTSIDFNELNMMTYAEKKSFLKQNEMNIRQCIGEAVPTCIMRQVAENIKCKLKKNYLKTTEIKKIIDNYDLLNIEKLKEFIKHNPINLDVFGLSRLAELSNANRLKNSAYYTDKIILTDIFEHLPDIDKEEIKILEPSVGCGNFIPFILKKYDHAKKIILDLVDIDDNSLEILKLLIEHMHISNKVQINYICDDFLKHEFNEEYDLIIGNPPFTKLNRANEYLFLYENNYCSNLAGLFLMKGIEIAENISFIMPKFLLNTPEFEMTRRVVNNYCIESIIDFGEKGFKGVKVETINIVIKKNEPIRNTFVKSITKHVELIQHQKYITDNKLPYWLIYRNKNFDELYEQMELGMFDVFRDRQITNSITVDDKTINNVIRVIKSRNIKDDGTGIEDIKNYDGYIQIETAKELSVYNYINKENVYLVPNMTYKPRMIKKPFNVLTNGSVAILIPKYDFEMSKEDMLFISSNEYREFYTIARNYQTRSLNIDKASVYFFGRRK